VRRRVAKARAGGPAPFVAPEGDYRVVWAAYEAWVTATTDHLAAHPGDADAVALARRQTHVPDAPFDPATL
jgi:hypothetical protein